ncbi:MAG: hypothetical protein D6809_04975 [Gammaproteobacteria bacterium]|nr:MAG: hypothetical protein D6809_04975 [Gammaproteobacteria bacterium]
MLAAVVVGLAPIAASADFSFNFAPDTAHRTYSGLALIQCNRPGEPSIGCTSFLFRNDPTPFLQERVKDPATGRVYYHVVVGRPQDGFAQEYFSWVGPSDGGQMGPGSSSFGDPDCFASSCNGKNPLGPDNVVTGSGTGGSYRYSTGQVLGHVSVRQLIGGFSQDPATGEWLCTGSYCDDFYKPWFRKPRIRQSLRETGTQPVSMSFELDLSGQDMLRLPQAPTPPTIRFSLGAAPGAAAFELSRDAPQARPSAGRYCRGVPDAAGQCTPPDRPQVWSDISLKQYTYFDGDLPLTQDWSIYRDPSQN